MPNQTERPDLIPPSCIHPDACECEIIETTEIVPTEIPLFIATHNGVTAGMPTAAQARDWLSDRHGELVKQQMAEREAAAKAAAKAEPVDAGVAADTITLSDDVQGVPS